MRIQNAKPIVIASSSWGELVTREANYGSVLARRSFLVGLGSLLAGPAIVRASSLMPVKAFILPAPTVIIGVRVALPIGQWRMLNQGVPYVSAAVRQVEVPIDWRERGPEWLREYVREKDAA